MPRRSKLTPVERKDIPRFTSEDEEHEFWATHSLGPGLLAEMKPAFDPELPSPDQVHTYINEQQERTKPVAIRFDADTLKRLRALASAKGTGYQTLLKTFVMERLYEEEKREGLLENGAAATGRRGRAQAR